MVALLTTLGIVLFFLGLLLSLAWHELGHLATAKMFGIRCTQYFVGFGKTLWSVRKGDTEYGIKLIPLGGFVRMVGMIPPARNRGETSSGKPMSRWRAMIEDARAANQTELEPGDEDRQFYQRAPWKRLIVMFAGPGMNLILAVVLFAVAMMGIGVLTPTSTVAEVSECVVPSSATSRDCAADADPTPAAEAGMKAGDRIVAVNGTEAPDNNAASSLIRDTTGPATITVERDGERMDLKANLVENEMPKRDASGEVVYKTDADGEFVTNDQGQRVAEIETAGFLGVYFTNTRQPLSAGETAGEIGTMAVGVGKALVALPSKVPEVFGAAFLGHERQIDSPVGIVGASRIGGEVLAQPVPWQDRAVILLNLLAGVNMFLFAFNMVPLLPLDGGHILGALWESVRRGFAKLFKRPDPGPFDVAQLMPVAYVVFIAFACFSVMLLVADLFNPVRLT
ncbi:membrane-associated protease RseP (regulator of RpoE activity) [Murinocardiopsis flavida]|uniref:Membrane-associated protease RseP (Regulator of RpoE activity) n=1 Tax=Murinocardiopsis flavida TaxID=645275 RepID=A0A2P8CW37_9ACTN|nr:site-2 protease family protein [Murinocardiopsis flavida]PSK89166.1 membrane-associated protease RseP (regulator of RpoE activity) [Murinocardiopsis flavida]